jgi:hypothetical protein
LQLETESSHNPHAVADGVSKLHIVKPTAGLQEVYHLYVLRSDTFNERQHKDTFYRVAVPRRPSEIARAKKRGKRLRPTYQIVHKEGATFQSTWDSDQPPLVPDRLIPLYSITPEGDTSYRVPMVFQISAAEPERTRLKFAVYGSPQKIPAHAALNNEDGTPRPGLTEYPMSFFDLPNLPDLGFEAKKALDGEWYYFVEGCVRLIKHLDHMSVRPEFFEKGEDFAYLGSKSRMPYYGTIATGF